MTNNQDENFDILRSTKRYIKGISESINDNGNVNGGSPMGAMLNIGATTTKAFYLQDEDYVPKHTAILHKSGAIHIHDLDFFSMTTTCAQIPLLHLLLGEVYMEHGWIRKAKSFSTACSLACIYLQSNQNDHHGGQGYPHFDYFLARFVGLEWLRQIKVLLDYTEGKSEVVSNLRDLVDEGEDIIFNSDPDDLLFDYFKTESFEKIQNEISIHFPGKLDTIEQNLRKEVFSGCQGILYNFNSMHCLQGDTLVKTVNGPKPIKDLKADEQVLSFNLETKTQEVVRVKEILNNGIQPLFKYTTAMGREIWCTRNHRILQSRINRVNFSSKDCMFGKIKRPLALAVYYYITKEHPEVVVELGTPYSDTDLFFPEYNLYLAFSNENKSLTDIKDRQFDVEFVDPFLTFEQIDKIINSILSKHMNRFYREIDDCSYIILEDGTHDPIISREYVGEEDVYDIAVDRNCNFILENGAVVHNSRAGGQVPFSSINLGTDTSYGGRLITEGILTELQKGLGHGEICIFPIVIFKLKNGISALPGDPNYDLYRLALKSAATRLYPTFLFLDAPFNLVYQDGNPIHEVALMGCVDYDESIKFSGYLKSPSDSGNEIGYYYDMVDFMYNNLDKIKDMENGI